ncbi:MAG TPA: alpha-amylase family glycosyl hydrolase [Candidatus Cloacimonadota bacterium]|nr:alpha-amylase family glycosyl hydrolase [Candidatus Cloacimonadota bacterium]
MKKLIITILFCGFYILLPAENLQSGETYWWNDVVFYEIFVRSFVDSDGDGIGDLNGLISQLDYLNDGDPETTTDLGITGIWLMPVCQSPSYHGYDVTDYQTIETDYGTNQDFLHLMDECHKRGIKVITDFVMNHCSSQHPWFAKAEAGDSFYRNWFRWKKSKPSYLGPWGQPVWHEANGEYYFGLFWGGMPDLNYDNKAVRREMKNIAKYWLTKMHVDGFRCDAAKHIFEDGEVMENVPKTFEWWREFHDFCKNVNPEALAVGEVWDSPDIVVKYLDNRFDFCFEFDLANTIIAAINASDADLLKNELNEIGTVYPYLQYGTFLTNHDQNRVMNQLAFDVEKAKFAASILLTLPGIPFIYYGEEIGMTGQKPDPEIRTPMQWNEEQNAGFSSAKSWHDVNANYPEFNVADEQKTENSLWQVYRKMISLREEHPALRRGTTQILKCDQQDVLAILRQYEDDAVLIIDNFGKDCEAIQIEMGNEIVLSGSYRLTDGISEEEISSFEMTENGNLNLSLPGIPKFETRVYEIKK